MLEVDHSYMQDEHALEGWMFSNYIALHWYYKIYQRLVKTGLISQYSAMDILDFLQEILKIKIDGYPVFRNGTPILAILRDNVQQLRHLGFLIGV